LTKEWSLPLPVVVKSPKSLNYKLIIARYRNNQLWLDTSQTSIANRSYALQLIAYLSKAIKNTDLKLTVKLVGHTEKIDEEEKSRQVSLYWATLEKNYFAEHLQSQHDKVTIEEPEGKKWLEPAGNDNAPEGRIANRYVEMVIYLK
jgi:hypothetical protein